MRRLPGLPSLPKAAAVYGLSMLSAAVLLVLIYDDSQQAAARMIALREGPPAAVPVQDFESGRDTGPTGEVQLRAQIDTSMPLQVVFRSGLTRQRAVVYPMLAAEIGADGTPVPVLGYLHVTGPLTEVEVLNPARYLPEFTNVGPVGPIINIQGEVGGSTELDRLTKEALAASGRPLADRLLPVALYSKGRLVALTAPRPSGMRLPLILLAVVTALLGGLLSRRCAREFALRPLVPSGGAGGRLRPDLPSVPATDKGRRRLAPLAPQQDVTERPTRPARQMFPVTSQCIAWLVPQMQRLAGRIRRTGS